MTEKEIRELWCKLLNVKTYEDAFMLLQKAINGDK